MWILGVLLLTGCSSSAEARPSPNAALGQLAPAPSAAPEASTPPPGGGVANASPTIPAAAPNAPPPPPPPDPKTGEVPRSLPELKLKLSGLHIGGGPNDTLTKRPFIETLESGFDAMRACYGEAEEPAKGGTFGVDLRVERAGGHPTIQAVRTAMKGEKFKACLERAFNGLTFGRPPKGPTVLSASVRFALEP